ncbi:MAG TPA: xanthine dehydrogenase family protein subunit M [Terracidiphilus sp.]|jgi:xanthine dehydrogenase YagS FAD-binding subunit|nr:xanthine dehydrogenase family protein subunit M [Terracidiphilus sp.]
MQTFNYTKATSIDKALAQASGAKFIAGGTTLVDLMKLEVEQPSGLVDINLLPLDKIEPTPSGGLRIGAMVRNSDLAWNPEVEKNYAVLSQALLSGASPQLRNMATTGGNLLQRTRCVYFREPSAGTAGGYGCNKRTPGTGCAAMDGFNRTHAVLGTSEHCIATHPSDMCAAMAALEAVIFTSGPKGKRTIAFADFHKLPGDTPHIENALEPGELVTYVELPKPVPGAKSVYLKLRDRASYEFALASAAVVAKVEGGHIRHIRVAMGGVGTRPWRSHEAEAALLGKPADAEHFRKAAEAALAGAKPQHENAFKIELAKRCVVRSLKMATA